MPGKKKKGKKEKKPKENDDKLAAVDRTFYEMTITDLNNKLARLRSHSAKLEETNEELNEKFRKVEEDRIDITAYLDRNLAEKKDIIKEMSEQLVELSKVREEEGKEAAAKIKEWEQRFKATQEQLSSEIKLLNGKLNSLEEFRVQKDDLLAKFDFQESQFRQQQQSHKEILYEMERKIVLDKSNLKKDVENRLLKLSDDFTKSGEIRIQAYTQRLIRQNIALNNEMDKMINSQRQNEYENKEICKKMQEMEEFFRTNEAIRQRLTRTCEHQVKIIDKLTEQLDVFKSKYGTANQYKKLYEEQLKRDTCERFTLSDMKKKLTLMGQRIEIAKCEKAKLIHTLENNEAEIVRLTNIIKNIKYAVQSAIRNIYECESDKSERKAQRKNLLSEIMQIITTYADPAVPVPSVSTISGGSTIYGTGAAGLMPRSASLLELFKQEARKLVCSEELAPDTEIKPSSDKITPSSRIMECETLFDVEIGTTLVASSANGDEEDLVEDDFDNEIDFEIDSKTTAKSPSTLCTDGTKGTDDTSGT